MAKIKLLDNIIAARIAAGEVIDRPQAVSRELLDNAIDSNATEIALSISGGGINYLSVVDNGCGIDKEDLEKTTLAHATSKISKLDDLYHISTLGFRGEALYSISAVSKLTISSKGYTYVADNTSKGVLKVGGYENGTTVTSEDLFASLPARRMFLKRDSSEATLVKNTFLSKATPFYNIHFKYYVDSNLKIDLPIRNTLFDRVLDILCLDESLSRKDFIKLKKECDEFSIVAICALSHVHRSDRSKIKIYVNNRQVEEFSLMQAVTYGYGELLPGGAFPYASIFITVNPELVDFNIHPAKKEVKLRNRAEIHHELSYLIKNGIPKIMNTIKNESVAVTKTLFEDEEFKLSQQLKREEISSKSTSYQVKDTPKDNSWLEKAKELTNINQNYKQAAYKKSDVWKNDEKKEIIYLGQAFKLFLICQVDDKLYLVDQHAAHERLIFNELKGQKTTQKLLLEHEFEVDSDIDSFLVEHSDIYTELGIMIAQKEKNLWTLTALPALARPFEKELIKLIQSSITNEAELLSRIYAIVACKSAIKAGAEVDRYSAIALLEKVFQLEDPSCPHGRSFIIALSEAELRKMVGRTN